MEVLSGHVYLPVIITLMMEAISTSEMSVSFYQTTRCNIPEDSYLSSYLPPREPEISPVRTFFCSKAFVLVCATNRKFGSVRLDVVCAGLYTTNQFR
jgi:hypothetical protein